MSGASGDAPSLPPVRPDEPTGGRIVVKKGGVVEAEFYARKAARRESPGREPGRSGRRAGRRFPVFLLAAPVLLVLVFALRNQRAQAIEPSSGTLSGCAVSLRAERADPGALISVTVGPIRGLRSLLTRERAPEAGTPVSATVFVGADGGSFELFGETAAPGDPDTVLQARVELGPKERGLYKAIVEIEGRTLSLYRTLEPR